MDEPPSKRCVSLKQFCSATISSKSTESSTAEVAAVSVNSGGRGGDKKSATTFLNLASITTVN